MLTFGYAKMRRLRTSSTSTATARAAADAVIAELDLRDTGTAWFGDPVTMRWVLIHMLEETARHAGHVDILREMIDGLPVTTVATDLHRQEVHLKTLATTPDPTSNQPASTSSGHHSGCPAALWRSVSPSAAVGSSRSTGWTSSG